MAKQEAALPLSCYIVLKVTTRSMLYPQSVSHAGCSNARGRRVRRFSNTFSRKFQSDQGTKSVVITVRTEHTVIHDTA